ncbi:hypothetical protein [Staphylococcus kloosii]|jgi:23S rRNA pseudoU1915 N3-methylase RlmH|uniref:hypothetical protein n=1 Tax=Staphylococcus kloosii TaxID=29384 RepID=UPI00189C975B|nr:hypothetical protein [Staphylococcus kloosii]MBF7028884.1 hypothetical protein [Staphylococcus kloosii]
MKIKLSIDDINYKNSYHKDGLTAYQARLKSPLKIGTQHIVEKLLQNNETLSLELKDTGERWEFYLNDNYISYVEDRRYKSVGFRMRDLDHLGLLKEETKSGYHKITPIIYSKIND